MKESKNIWGQPGCRLPDGSMCTACCVLYRIPELNKPADTFCRFQIPGQGCGIHNQLEQPTSCRTYRCENHPEDWEDLIQRALLIGSVDLDQANRTRKRLNLTIPRNAQDIIDEDNRSK